MASPHWRDRLQEDARRFGRKAGGLSFNLGSKALRALSIEFPPQGCLVEATAGKPRPKGLPLF